MAEKLLHGAQVRTALEHVGRRRVPKPVGGEVGDTCPGGQSMHGRTHGPRVDAPTTGPDEQRRSRMSGDREPSVQPVVDRALGRNAERHHPLLVALAPHPHPPARRSTSTSIAHSSDTRMPVA